VTSRHYLRLNYSGNDLPHHRVIVHDSFGHHQSFFPQQNAPLTYLNYTIWSAIGWKIPDREAEGNNIVVRLGDQVSAPSMSLLLVSSVD